MYTYFSIPVDYIVNSSIPLKWPARATLQLQYCMHSVRARAPTTLREPDVGRVLNLVSHRLRESACDRLRECAIINGLCRVDESERFE